MIKQVKFIIFLLFLIELFFSISIDAQQIYSRFYDLNFTAADCTVLHPWTTHIRFPDKTLTYRGKHPILIESEQSVFIRALCNSNKTNIPLPKATVLQYIWLPGSTHHAVAVSFTYKNTDLKSIKMILCKKDKDERILSTDTFPLPLQEQFHTAICRTSINGASFLAINIEVKGNMRKRSDQRLWIDRLALTIDGKNIDSYTMPSLKNKVALNTGRIIPLSLSDNISYSRIEYLNNKRLLGIGESVHGCKEMEQTAFNIIRRQVEAGKCKLVLLEYPLVGSMGLNRCVHGDSAFPIDSLLKEEEHLKIDYDVSDLKLLCEWLRTYNLHHTEKVSLLGMDVPQNSQNNTLMLCNYVYEYNRVHHFEVLDSLYKKILSYNKEFGWDDEWNFTGKIPVKLSTFLDEQETQLKNALGEDDYALMKQSLVTINNTNQQQINNYDYPPLVNNRDSFMYANLLYLKKRYHPEQTIVYSHTAHLAYHKFDIAQFCDPLGYYLKRDFGEDYGAISMMTGEGTYEFRRDGDKKNLVPSNKIYSLPNSIEELLGTAKNGYYYIPVSGITRSPYYMRYVGAPILKEAQQFVIAVPHNRMDGIIFIRNCHPTYRPLLNYPLGYKIQGLDRHQKRILRLK